MNSSAKTTLTFLASAALGAAIFMGCTVTSGTTNDTDGGTQNNRTNDDDKDSGTTNTGNDSGGSTDADAAVGSQCQSKQTDFIVSVACQACLETSCCTELQGCYDLPADGNAGQVDCNGYTECIDALRDECNAKPTPQEVEACFAPCDTTAAPGVQAAYKTLTTCLATSCATACQ